MKRAFPVRLIFVFMPLLLAACSEIGDTRPAQRTVNTGTELRPASEINEETLLRLARGLEAQGDLGQALRVYSRVVSDYPGTVGGRLGLARVYEAAGAPNRAYNQYIEAFERAPGNAEAVAGVARHLAREGNPGDAERLLALHMAEQPPDVRIMRTMGLMQDLTGRHQDAQLQYARALDMQPSDSETLNLLALSFGLSGEVQAGLEMLDALQDTDSGNVRNRALLHALRGNADAARTTAARVYDDDELEELARLFRALPHLEADMRRRVVLLGVEPETLPEPPEEPQEVPVLPQPQGTAPPVESPSAIPPQPAAEDSPTTAGDGPEWQPDMPSGARENLPGRYWVQLGSFASRAGAEAGWVTLNSRAGEVLSGYLPYLERFEAADGSFYFRLLVGGYADAPPARELCMALEAASQACFVARKSVALTPLESTP